VGGTSVGGTLVGGTLVGGTLVGGTSVEGGTTVVGTSAGGATSAGGTVAVGTSVEGGTTVGETVMGGTTSEGETSVDDGTEVGELVTDDRLALPGNGTSLEDGSACVSCGSSLDNVVVGSKGGVVSAIEFVPLGTDDRMSDVGIGDGVS
jgi:hypothetical protein